MGGPGELFRWQTVVGEPTTIGETTVTPESSVLTVCLPGGRAGGFVWNRPLAVTVQRAGQSERIPIVDVTRIAQLGLLLSMIALSLIMAIVSVRRKERSE